MQTFSYDLRRWWISRVFSGNPLVRATDRVEALVIMLAIVVSLLVIPVAGAVGSAIYDVRAHLYARQARTWHQIEATITGTGRKPIDPDSGLPVVQLRWATKSGWRTASLPWPDPVQPGDVVQVGVDADENLADAPPPTSNAGSEAVTIAVSIVLLVMGASASLVAATRWQLDRIRDAQAEREIRTLVG